MDLLIPLVTVPCVDIILYLLFGNRSRWFQLHCTINGIIVYILWQDVVEIVCNPLTNIKTLNTQMDTYFIIVLHLYHLLLFRQLTFMDYFHHILFIGTGVIPALLFYNINYTQVLFFIVGLFLIMKIPFWPYLVSRLTFLYVFIFVSCIYFLLTLIKFIDRDKLIKN